MVGEAVGVDIGGIGRRECRAGGRRRCRSHLARRAVLPAVAILAVVGAGGCGGSLDSLASEAADLADQTVAVLESVKDESGAAAARQKLADLAARMRDVIARSEALDPKPTAGDFARVLRRDPRWTEIARRAAAVEGVVRRWNLPAPASLVAPDVPAGPANPAPPDKPSPPATTTR